MGQTSVPPEAEVSEATELDPKTERRRQVRELVRQDVLAAVVRVATEDGVAQLTMSKVAIAAGVAKGTLYLHFSDKDEMVRAAIDWVVAPLVEQVVEVLDSDHPPFERLREMARLNLEYFDQQRDFFRLFMFERYLAQTQPQRHQTPHYQRVLMELTRLFAQGLETGAFRPLEPATVAQLWLESVNVLVIRRLVSDSPSPSEKDLETLTALYSRGILAV